MRTRRFITGTFVFSVASITGVLGGAVLAQQDPSNSGGWPIECASDDLVATVINEIGEDAKGGPSQPEVSLDSYLRDTYPGIAAGEFVRDSQLSEDSDSDGYKDASFHRNEPGRSRPDMIVRLEEIGDSWHVAGFTACNGLLVEAEKGQGSE